MEQTKPKHGKRIAIKSLHVVILILLITAISVVVALIVHNRGSSVPASTKPGGLSAYDLAVENGYTGDLEQWLMSLAGETGPEGKVGKSAFELAVENGYTGSMEQWLGSLIGVPGKDGKAGSAGKSAYDLAVENGYTGTLDNWLTAIVGASGPHWNRLKSTRPSSKNSTPSARSRETCAFSPPKAKALDTSPSRLTTRKQGMVCGSGLTCSA